MLSNKPYLLRAFHQWIVDSACTPILVLDAANPRCKIPKDYAEDGEIVFNISSSAVRDLKITNDRVEFTASFSGVVHLITAPIKAIIAIYAEENGEGLFVDPEEDDDNESSVTQQVRGLSDGAAETRNDAVSSGQKKPFLTLVE